MACQEQGIVGWMSSLAQIKLAGRARSYEMVGFRLTTLYKIVAGLLLVNTGITGKSYSNIGISTVG